MSEIKGPRILIVDDEVQICRLLKLALNNHGYQVEQALSGLDAVDKASMFHPDLVILDLGLPDIDGIEVIRRLRDWTKVPIVVLSAWGQEKQKIQALDVGADDYVTKPFSMGELLARIRVALRHASPHEGSPVMKFGRVTVDLAQRLVQVEGHAIKLTPTEYEILKLLATNAGRVITHKQLLKSIWGEPYAAETSYLRVYIGQLRRKLEQDPTRPQIILTEPGVGYRLVADI